LGFGVGLVIGALIVERSADAAPWPKAVTQALALEVLILAVFTVSSYVTAVIREVWEAQSLIALSAIAMGVQSAAARRLDVLGIATTYLTGTFTSAVTGLVAKSRHSPRTTATQDAVTSHPWRRQVALQLLTLVVYGLGALIAGLLQGAWPGLVAILPFASSPSSSSPHQSGSIPARRGRPHFQIGADDHHGNTREEPPERTVNRLVVHSERGLCPRPEFSGGGSEGGQSPPPSLKPEVRASDVLVT